jgi:glycosyltransferase involved in cell wall biosynthesis
LPIGKGLLKESHLQINPKHAMPEHIIFDIKSQGHGLNDWCALVRSHAFQSFCSVNKVTALVPASLAEKILTETKNDPRQSRIHWEVDETLASYDSFADRAKAMKRLIGLPITQKASSILMMYGDTFLPFMPWLRLAAPRAKLSCLWFRPAAHFREYGYKVGVKHSKETSSYTPLIKSKILHGFLRTKILNQVAYQDEAGVEWARRRGLNVIHFPAPPSVDYFARLPQQDSESGCTKFTLFGVLDERKGIFKVMRAFGALSPELMSKCRLNLVGRTDPEQKEKIYQALDALRKTGLSVHIDDRFVAQSEVREIYARSDVMLLLYEGAMVQPSGVLVQSAAFGRPVLATDAGWVGYTVKKHRLGLAVDTTNTEEMTKAIKRMVEGERNFDPEQAVEFARTHAPEKYGEAIVQLLET